MQLYSRVRCNLFDFPARHSQNKAFVDTRLRPPLPVRNRQVLDGFIVEQVWLELISSFGDLYPPAA